jgi:hypothetical protein
VCCAPPTAKTSKIQRPTPENYTFVICPTICEARQQVRQLQVGKIKQQMQEELS